MSAPFLLEARNLRVSRGGSLVLDVPRLEVAEGTVLSLIGPNGAGKTTLLAALSLLERPSSGQVLFRGEPVPAERPLHEYRRRLAMVFQEPLLFDTTVLGNVAAGLKIRGKKEREAREIAQELMEQFGIAALAWRSARTLSGGEAQRTSLARAFATNPELLLLDEPFSSLDPRARESLMADLEAVLGRRRTTVLFATHDRIEALRLSDRVAVMNQGRIVQAGPPGEVMNRPADPFVASFVGIETILEGRVLRSGEGSLLASVARPGMSPEEGVLEAVGEAGPGESVLLCIRPENVTLSLEPSGDITSARNRFRGRITRVLPLGLFSRVELDCGFPLVAFVTKHSVEALALREGTEAVASFKATAVHVIRRR